MGQDKILLIDDGTISQSSIELLAVNFTNVKRIVDTREIELHLMTEGNSSNMIRSRWPIDQNYVVMFHGLPSSKIPSQIRPDFFYTEWKCSIEAILEDCRAKVINKGWIFGNYFLQSSNTYWGCLIDSLDIEGVNSIPNKAGSVKYGSVECYLTLYDFYTPIPNIVEFEDNAFDELFYLIREHMDKLGVDILTIAFLLGTDCNLYIESASATLPNNYSNTFIEALHGIL